MPEMHQRGSLLSAVVSNSTSRSQPRAAESDPTTVNSIPPWVHVNDDAEDSEEASALLSAPGRARPNTRHYRPPPPQHYKPGRKWDHLRDAEPALLSEPITQSQQRWKSFMQSGPNPQSQEGRVVSQAWMQEHMPDLNPDWHPDDELEQGVPGFSAKGLMYKGKWLISPERQERTVRLFWRLLLKNPYMPLIFRVTIVVFTAAALGMAASIYHAINRVNHDADPHNQCAKRASTYMAIAVGSIALPYIGYVTWDEYMSKPLGLRSVAAKIWLLLCDLYFIVFASSNLSLALDALLDHRWACYDERISYDDSDAQVQATCPDNPGICQKQRILSGLLVVCLCAWCVTFSISVLRVVEKLRPD